jgi:hypothetical protein
MRNTNYLFGKEGGIKNGRQRGIKRSEQIRDINP